ncbi:hypothetical protein DW091_19375 [Eubacterium sp. AM05-23]|nr:hypothetical protein DW091_19375 [Eubacterium sp. AM05-23]
MQSSTAPLQLYSLRVTSQKIRNLGTANQTLHVEADWTSAQKIIIEYDLNKYYLAFHIRMWKAFCFVCKGFFNGASGKLY